MPMDICKTKGLPMIYLETLNLKCHVPVMAWFTLPFKPFLNLVLINISIKVSGVNLFGEKLATRTQITLDCTNNC